MRLLKISTILLFILSCAAYGVSEFVYKRGKDFTAPVITADSDLLEVSVKDDSSKFYEGMHASDDHDGDLSDSILISGESYFLNSNECTLRYVVFDKAHNSASYKRTIRYTDYTPPHFELDKPLVFKVGSSVRFADDITATDCIDGDITGKIRILSSTVSNYMEGIYPVSLEVMNSHGQKATVDINVMVTSQKTEPNVELKEYITYVKQGDDFNPYSLIKSAVTNNGRNVEAKKVRVNGSVDTNMPGTYILSYTVTTGDALSAAYLSVVVEEAQHEE